MWPFNKYPYTNYHDLNLQYFLEEFSRIFEQWQELYQTMNTWKDATTAELEQWKTDVESDMTTWESDLLAQLDVWKAGVNADITAWETALLASLDAWKTAFETLFNTTFSDLVDIKTDAEAARDAAQAAQAAAEAAAETLELDPTLTSATQAAQAKATGDWLRSLSNRLTLTEIQALTTVTDMPRPSYMFITSATLESLLPADFPYTLTPSTYWLVTSDYWQTSSRAARITIERVNGKRRFVGTASSNSPDIISTWNDVSYNTLSDEITNLDNSTSTEFAAITNTLTGISQRISSSTLSSITDMPRPSYMFVSTANLSPLLPDNFPYTLTPSTYWLVTSDYWYTTNTPARITIERINGKIRYVGTASSGSPDVISTWNNVSYSDLESSVADAQTDIALLETDSGSFIETFTRITPKDLTWQLGKWLGDNGSLSNNEYYATSDFFPVHAGQMIYNPMPQPDSTGYNYYAYINIYNSSNVVILRVTRTSYTPGVKIVVPEDGVSARVCYGHPSTDNIPMTTQILQENYEFYITLPTKPQVEASNDVYVAFGASTTIGAVHHFTPEPYTLSMYDYPDYVGAQLGIKTYNLAVGSTGLMARGASGNLNNMMDQIYTHDAELAAARLITLHFGYGNDAGDYVEYHDGDTVKHGLPVGTIYDYYPYDEENHHPEGFAGIDTMVNLGATLFGCLNWCIKWLSTHYPKAQIVLIWGIMSENTGIQATNSRAITQTQNQSESIGSPKYTLTFAEPTGSLAQINPLVKELTGLYNIDLINQFDGGLPMTYWAARTQDNTGKYILFSTTGTAANPVMNVHPSDEGYLMLSRYVAAKILSLYYR